MAKPSAESSFVASLKVNVPKSPSKFASKQQAINIAKCQLYQWLEVQTIPNPQRSQLYLQTIQRQYPSLQFNEATYNLWLEDIAYIYRSKYTPEADDDEDNKAENETTSDPEWMSLQNGTIKDQLLQQYKIGALSVEDRCLGCILGVFIVDALGAPVEGWPYDTIIEKYNPKGIIHMIPGTHMGARNKGARCGYYTDDTMTTMALALSIVQNQKLSAQHAAENYYKFWKTNPIYRGLPDSAQKVLHDVIDGMSISVTGRQSFEDGSYANGGAMRISGVGLAYRNADCAVLKRAVTDAILSSHCHPQSIDGAMCIALMIQFAMKSDVKNEGFDYKKLVGILLENMETQEMKNQIQTVIMAYDTFLNEFKNDNVTDSDLEHILQYDIAFLRESKLLTFQIKAIEAVPFVLYCLLRWYKTPEKCAINVVTLGGDCDTTGSMIGGILGCLYGTRWIAKRWFDNLENTWIENKGDSDENKEEMSAGTEAYGLDLALFLGIELAKLNFKEHDSFAEIKTKDTNNSVFTKIKNVFSSKTT